MSKNVFGDKVGAKQYSFMIDEEKKELYTAYYPTIIVNSKECLISSKDYKTGKVNADTRYRALKLGREYLKKFKEEEIGV